MYVQFKRGLIMEMKINKNNNYKSGEIIKIIREWAELSQRDFAKSINVSTQTVQSYETNRRVYNINTLKKIAEKHDLEIIIRKK